LHHSKKVINLLGKYIGMPKNIQEVKCNSRFRVWIHSGTQARADFPAKEQGGDAMRYILSAILVCAFCLTTTGFTTIQAADESQQEGQAAVQLQAEKSPGSKSIAQGEEIFNEKCAACHTIGGGRKIGPDLKGVTEKREHEWLVKFISNPEKMYEEGDPIAAELLKEYGIKMPNQNLSDEQVTDVIAYLQSTSAESQAAPPEKEAK
jgi:mono/diheme cytochrome c family protein